MISYSKRSFLAIFVGAVFATSALAVQQANAAQPQFYSTGSGAIGGHDVVAYFTQGKAVKGSAQHQTRWNGADWRFASAENLEAFLKSPERYVPQYGGYCAYGVSQGYAVKIDPTAFTINNGRLYLNYSRSVSATWRADIPGYVKAANKNWPAVLSK